MPFAPSDRELNMGAIGAAIAVLKLQMLDQELVPPAFVAFTLQ